eukprot:7716400-Pyramimonas_sp.AAC.1
MEQPWSKSQGDCGAPLESVGNRNGTSSPSVSYTMTNGATTQNAHSHQTKRRRRRTKHNGA